MSPESGTSPAPQRARRKRQLCIVSPEPDTGRGIGASHQTGWTGLIAKLIHPRRPEG